MLYRTDIVGLSTEEKPIKGLENGATYYCVDNGDLYIFYKGQWYLQEFVEPNETNETNESNEPKGISLISNNKETEETEETEKKDVIENEELFVDEK